MSSSQQRPETPEEDDFRDELMGPIHHFTEAIIQDLRSGKRPRHRPQR